MLRFAFNFLLFFMLFCLILVVGLLWYLLPQLPETDILRDVRMQVPLRIYSHNNSLIAEFGEKRRQPVSMADIPTTFVHAFLAAEDSRFFQHPGVDWQGLTRAAIYLLKTGEKGQGGSTITMQVARNFFLSREKTYARKLNEILLALKIDHKLSKEEILELYLNKIYLGHRAHGINAAARTYYGSNIQELTLAQIAMLAALPKAPSDTNPIRNPHGAKERRNYVLRRMLEEDFIDDQTYQQTIATPLTASLYDAPIQLKAPYVAEMVRKQILEEYGEEAYLNGIKVITTIRDKNQAAANYALHKALTEYDQRHGYRGPEDHIALTTKQTETDWGKLLQRFPTIGNIYPALVTRIGEKSITAYLSGVGQINIDWEGMQWARPYISKNRQGKAPTSAADILRTGDVIRLQESSDGTWKLSQIPEVQGAIISLRPQNGETLALVGGFDFQQSKFNRATQAHRQPGSGFKPFVYSAALAAGNTAATTINDAPVAFEDKGTGTIWRPENYSHKYYGPTRLREALTHSRNIVAVRLLDAIGIPFALKHIVKFGFEEKQLPKNLSMALGSATLTPWQMASAYCVFANGGYRVEPHVISRIESYQGNTIAEIMPLTVCDDCEARQSSGNVEQLTNDAGKRQPPYAERVIEARNIWIMNTMTKDVIQHGTARRARVLGRSDLSGKTGTTNDQRDAWFYGFNQDIVSVSWVGFDSFQPLGKRETGGKAALPMWIEYMRTALDGIPEKTLPSPSGLVYLRIDPNTGKPATPDNSDAIFEVFRSELAPSELADNHQLAPPRGPTDDQGMSNIF